jgi:hypothetical protein
MWVTDPGVNFLSLYFEPPHGKLNPPSWAGGSKYHGLGGRYTMSRGVDIPSVGGSKFSQKNLKFKSFKKFENLKIKKNI